MPRFIPQIACCHVVIPLLTQHTAMLLRNLVYIGLTRGKPCTKLMR